jgi:hypothetical protein
MLDIMRKHASSWGIKVLLGMIIVSFVLFFGYRQIARSRQATVRGGKGQQAVAYVNHMAVPSSEYQFYYDQAAERVREQFKGKQVPEFMEDVIERSTLSRLVQRELLLQIADELGIRVTDEELARYIRQSQIAQRGDFDQTFYTTQYLPYFKNRFGIDFEDMLRNDIRAEKVQLLFVAPAEAATKKDMGEKDTVKSWTLEVVTLDVDKMIKDKLVASQAEAEKAAQEFVDYVSDGMWKQMSNKYGAKLETVEGVTIDSRNVKLPGYTLEQYEGIFALGEDLPVVDKPIVRNDNKIAVLRFIEHKDVERGPKATNDDFFRNWMQQTAAKAKIQTFLDDQKTAKQ